MPAVPGARQRSPSAAGPRRPARRRDCPGPRAATGSGPVAAGQGTPSASPGGPKNQACHTCKTPGRDRPVHTARYTRRADAGYRRCLGRSPGGAAALARPTGIEEFHDAAEAVLAGPPAGTRASRADRRRKAGIVAVLADLDTDNAARLADR